MPNDINSNIYEYSEVLSSIHMLQSLYNPNFIICGGDWKTDLTRKTSLFTKSLVRRCDNNGLTCVNFVIFEMRKIHKKLEQIDSNQKQIKKTRIAKGFIVVRLPRHMEGNVVIPIFRSLQNCQFHHKQLESLEHFNVLYIYIILSTTVSHFFYLTDAFFFTRSPLFLYTFPFLQVHFACVLCI